MSFRLNTDAPLIRAPEKRYSYSFRVRQRQHIEFYWFIKNWAKLEIGECRALPGSNGVAGWAANDDQHLRSHFHKFAREAGLYAGKHYGIQRDTRDNCLKIVKFAEAEPGRMREDYL